MIRLKTKDYSGNHNVFNIFGIKLKLKSKKYNNLIKQFNSYKNRNIDITTYPKATGMMRKSQMANFALLLFLDKLCKENNISCWLDFGSLLGAVRHKGFIPWDDDIDVSMIREDYEKIIDIVNNNKYNPDIYAEYNKLPNGDTEYLITKIRHKKCPKLFVDIFPYDYLGRRLTHEEQLLYSKMVYGLRENLSDYTVDTKTIKRKLDKIREHLILCKDVSREKSDLIWGYDYKHSWKNWVYPQDIIFPLKEIEFEGHSLKCVNNPDYFLKEVYGDYMSYPKSLDRVHDVFAPLADEEQTAMEDLIREAGLTL